MKSWQEVYNSDEFRNLSTEEQDKAQNQYFEEVVKPRVPVEDISIAKQQFEDFAKSTRENDDQASRMVSSDNKAIIATAVDTMAK